MEALRGEAMIKMLLGALVRQHVTSQHVSVNRQSHRIDRRRSSRVAQRKFHSCGLHGQTALRSLGSPLQRGRPASAFAYGALRAASGLNRTPGRA